MSRPDDLPRSPTGRVPQWVVDEAAGGRPPAPDPWRPYAPPGPGPWGPHAPQRRRPLGPRLGIVAVAGLLGAWLALVAAPQLLDTGTVPWLGGAGRAPEPSAEVVALVDTMPLTPTGRDLLLATGPELLGAEQFAGRCDRGPAAVSADGVVGCYLRGGPTSADRIVVYRPGDERLRGFVVETLAHELLHAAWDRLDGSEQETAEAVLGRVVAGVDPGDDLHTQLAGSVGSHPGSRATEMFAYVGTQVWQPGGLDPALEQLYARYVSDRAALVAVHTEQRALLDTLVAEVEAAQSALVNRQGELAREEQEVAALAAALAEYRAVIEAQEAELAALPAAERSRRLLGWTWHDGTPLPMAAADRTLAEARRLLARDEADLAARQTRLAPTQADLAAERARVDALRTDVQTLLDQLDPAHR